MWRAAGLVGLCFSSVSTQVLADVGCRDNETARGQRSAFFAAAAPYKPRVIVDPTGDIDCDDLLARSATCSDFPLRLCDWFPPCQHRVCLHKAFFPVLPGDLVLLAAMFAIAFLSGAPGIGGGGIIVPTLMFLGRFDVKEAVPLSHISVMGNAMSQLLLNTPQRHPSCASRPLIHYEVAALLLPAMLGGNSLGVVVGQVFPPTLMVVLSILLLALASAKTAVKGWRLMVSGHDAASARSAAAALRGAGPPAGSCAGEGGVRRQRPRPESLEEPGAGPRRRPELAEPLAAVDKAQLPGALAPHGWPTVSAGVAEVIDSSLQVRTWSGHLLPGRVHNADGSASRLPAPGTAASGAIAQMRVPAKVIAFMLGFNLLFCLDYLAMSKDVWRVKKCSVPYWTALLVLYPVVAASIYIAVLMLRELQRWHQSRGEGTIEGDPEVTARSLVVFPALAALVGLLAGLLGLGGGELLVPLLLELGLPPRVAGATSGFMIFFTTSSNLVHYLIAGTVQPFLGYGVACFFTAMVGSLSGVLVGNTRYVKERSFLIVYVVAFLLALSGFLLVWRGLLPPVQAEWDFRPLCS